MSLYNVRFILVDSFLTDIDFAYNKNSQKNSIPKTIYKNSNKILKNKTNIEYKIVKKRLQKDKKNYLTF